MARSVSSRSRRGSKTSNDSGGDRPQAPSWLKRGSSARDAFRSEQKRIDERRNRLFRFWLSEEEECRITFLDGDLIQSEEEKGMLDCYAYAEHTVLHNRKWDNFVCLAEEGHCPICAAGNDPSMVALFTVIDHRSYTSKRGGKVYKDQRKLFVAKRGTLKKLQKQASKRGGLRGWTVEVSRFTDRDPRVGEVFEFVEQLTIDEIVAKYGKDKGVDTDYLKEIPYYPAAELVKMGLGMDEPGSDDHDEDDDGDDVPF